MALAVSLSLGDAHFMTTVYKRLRPGLKTWFITMTTDFKQVGDLTIMTPRECMIYLSDTGLKG